MKYFLANKLRPLLALLFIVGTLAACKKDDPEPTKTDLLAGTSDSGKSWSITDLQATIAGLPANNPIATMLNQQVAQTLGCSRDDLITFFRNGRVTTQPGTNKCDPAEATETGNWNFKNGETVLSYDNQDLKIDELTATTARLSLDQQQTIQGFGTITITLRFTFTAK